MSSAAIEIADLHKSYGRTEVLRGLTLNVARGSLCGFLGRNGAGKTTTLKILLGMARANRGAAKVLGYRCDLLPESLAIRSRAAFVSESKGLYPYMTVAQMIAFTRGFFPGWRGDLEQRYLKILNLPCDRKVGKLSKGMQTQLMMLLAMARGAELLILDEPAEGLDPVAGEEVLQALVSLASESGVTVFFSTHDLTQVEQIGDEVAILDGGRLVLHAGLEDLRARYRRLFAVFEDQAPEAIGVDGVERIAKDGRRLSLLVSHGADVVEQRARSLGALSVEQHPVTLKEIFLETVKGKS